MEDTHPLQLTEDLMHLPRDPVPLMIPETVAVALALSFSDLWVPCACEHFEEGEDGGWVGEDIRY